MAAVANAMLLAGQQAIDQLFVSVGRFVVEKRVLLGGRRRDADQVQIDAAQQRALVGRADRRDFLSAYSAWTKASIGFVFRRARPGQPDAPAAAKTTAWDAWPWTAPQASWAC